MVGCGEIAGDCVVFFIEAGPIRERERMETRRDDRFTLRLLSSQLGDGRGLKVLTL